MGRWSRVLAGAAVDWLDAPAGLRWLDVGCGTGALSEAIVVGAAPMSLVGVDPSEAYVGLATARLRGAPAVFHVGPAAPLPLPDESVDRVGSGLVLNFVPDPVAAVREMQRVLVPGGMAAAYVWDYADGMQMLRLFWDAAIAEDAAAEALDEGPRFPICRPGGLERCFAEAGMTELVAQPLVIDMVFRDFDDYWTPFLGGQGPAAGYCTSLAPAARAQLRERLRAVVPTGPDGSIPLTGRAWAVRGITP
jgi:SAM-dependent methyltransferase